VEHLILVSTRFIIVTAWSESTTLSNLPGLEFVQAFLPVTSPGKTVKNFNTKLIPPIQTDGIVQVAPSAIVDFGNVTVQANLEIVLSRLTDIFLIWLVLALYRIYKGHSLLQMTWISLDAPSRRADFLDPY
jgi:hypothetical protein